MLVSALKLFLNKVGLLDSFRQKQLYRDLAVRFNKNLKKEHLADMEFYGPFFQSGHLCFDIGANIGGKTNIFYKLGAQVVAVEPDPSAFLILSKRFGKNKKVSLLNKGVGSSAGFLSLNRSNSSTLSTFDSYDAQIALNDPRFLNISYIEKNKIEIITLDSLIRKYGLPAYCKIAVVGYELNVLKGLSHPIKAISFTCNIPGHIEKTIECVNLIDRLGIYKYNYFLSTLLNGFAEQKWIKGEEMKKRLSEMTHIPDHSKYIEIFAVQDK